MTDQLLSDRFEDTPFYRSCVDLWYHVRELMRHYELTGERAGRSSGNIRISNDEWLRLGDNAKSLLMWESFEYD